MAFDHATAGLSGSPSVYLLDSSPVTLALVAESLDASGRVRVVGIAANRPDIYPAVEATRPDAVIIDRVPGGRAAMAFRAAVDGCGAKVVLHCATAPAFDQGALRTARVDAVVFKEVGRIGELIDTVWALAGAVR